MKKWHWFLLAIILVGLDQFSKFWVESVLIPYKPMPVFPMLNITLAYNTGAAFSFLSGAGGWHRWFFAVFSLIVSVILLIWLWRLPKEDKLQSLGVSFILGGAVGNLIDRVFSGCVVDFIDVYYEYHHFATFNLADSAICFGAAILMLDLLLQKDQPKDKHSTQSHQS
ncbi:MAG: signal peptidase II [Legionella sp.]|nr:MAG: signal peptidase II [Legionella sp.]PJD99395.1 MAG: signal peptidase II [Legionella sp.]